MKFFTLLHIAENEISTHNNRSGTFTDQIQIYVKCIKLLCKSLQHQGFNLSVITNNKDFLSKFFDGFTIEIIELKFTMKVPSGADFYSPHFKNEVYKYFATCGENYVALIDSDIVCVNKMPLSFQNCIDNAIALYYDISNQVHPVFGNDVILRDKRTVDKDAKVGIWAGGEFIAGPPQFFKELYKQVEDFSPDYFKNIKTFHHQSDEFLTSVAVEDGILHQRYIILDAGVLNIIGRYWNYPTVHSQPAFDVFKECFLLHLPANKKMLARIDVDKVNFDNLFGFLKPKMLAQHSINTIKYALRKMMPAGKK
jgi:hypothetical protein